MHKLVRAGTRFFFLFTLVMSSHVWARDNLSFLPHSWGFLSYPRLIHRINAHGDEFNKVLLTPDEKRLLIGTEKGDVVVWNIAARKVEKRIDFKCPIHAMALFTIPDTVVVAGGGHEEGKETGVIGLVNFQTGGMTYVQRAGKATVVHVSVDSASGRLISADSSGQLTAWAPPTARALAQWSLDGYPLGMAVSGSCIFVATIPFHEFTKFTGENQRGEAAKFSNQILMLSIEHPEESPKAWKAGAERRIWIPISASPDGRILAALSASQESEAKMNFWDLPTGRSLLETAAEGVVWLANNKATLIRGEYPVQIVTFASSEALATRDLPKVEGFHGSGQPSGTITWVVSKDARYAWAVLSQQSGVAFWDLYSNEKPEIMAMTPSMVYAMDFKGGGDRTGVILTGGDDGFVRCWEYPSFKLRTEFRVPVGVPQGVALLSDGSHAVVSYGGEGNTEILVANIHEGTSQRLTSVNQPGATVLASGMNFLYPSGNQVILAPTSTGNNLRAFSMDFPVERMSLSANGSWLAVADQKGNLALFAVESGQRVWKSSKTVDSVSRIAVSRDGRYVYTTEWVADIKRWDTQEDQMKSLGGHRGQCITLRLSEDERYIVIGGNHRDFMVFDAETGDQLFYDGTPDADFSVTNAWLDGARLIFTTDAGILIECELPPFAKDSQP
jgi:WD40 repeat protein